MAGLNKLLQVGEAIGHGFWSGTHVKQATKEGPITFKNPVKLTDGSRVSGFSDNSMQSLYGYDKNGEVFTIDPVILYNDPVVGVELSAKSNNKVAQDTAKKLQQFITKKGKEATPDNNRALQIQRLEQSDQPLENMLLGF